MPTASGKMQLQDFDAALVVRGFSAFQPTERQQMINFAYRDIGRKFPMTWKETSRTYNLTPGQYQIAVGGGSPFDMESIQNIIITTDPYRTKLQPESYHRFQEKWLMDDLTAQSGRSTPARYIVYQEEIWILPPPQLAMTFQVFFTQFLADMVTLTDTTVIPQAFDEVILDAALVRCHRRAHELTLAAEAQGRVDVGIEELLALDVFQSEELQERVLPDDSWF